MFLPKGQRFIVTLNAKCCSVKHTMLLTMTGAYVWNAAPETKSTLYCFVCAATSKDFYNLNTAKEIESTLKFGLSILARIRIFEKIFAFRLQTAH